MGKLADFFLEMIYPPMCVICDRPLEKDGYCKRCNGLVEKISEETCFNCGIEAGHCECDRFYYHFDGVVAPYYNEDFAQRIVYKLKFEEKYSCATVFGQDMAIAAAAKFGVENIDLVTFVPADKKSLMNRGYNQSELFAKRVAEVLDKRLDGGILGKSDNIKTQHDIDNVGERYGNVFNAFYSLKRVDGMNILLVDDIKTTGATLDACARELKFAGANRVFCVTALVTRRKKRD